jgi:hypothetical protein
LARFINGWFYTTAARPCADHANAAKGRLGKAAMQLACNRFGKVSGVSAMALRDDVTQHSKALIYRST